MRALCDELCCFDGELRGGGAEFEEGDEAGDVVREVDQEEPEVHGAHEVEVGVTEFEDVHLQLRSAGAVGLMVSAYV